jgi:phospholipid/cholesterol/gamma-HCH transport system substrate-binding protein
MSGRFKTIRLGLFVLIGTVLLILALYLIGNKQNLFGDTFRISARFYNVNGLMQGNNVRFAGIDIGTVENIEIISDSSVKVTMVVEKNIRQFIKKNAVASVGTDGLMGNKLVNINAGIGYAENVKEGDELNTLRPIEMDEMVRTLNATNENMKVITSNLRNITDKINSKNSLWNLLLDTVVADNVKAAIVNLKLMSNRGVMITDDLKYFTEGIKKGKGSLGALITDTILSSKLTQVVIKFEKLNDTAAVLGGDISGIVKNLKSGKGTIGVLLNDTTLVHDLNKSIKSIDKGAMNFDENMDAVKQSWPFKKYFRKKKTKK